MEVTIRGKKHTFNVNIVSNYTEKDFTEYCCSLAIFNELPVKERNAEIKKAYGNLKADAKESRKSREKGTRSDIHSDDAEQLGRDSREKQGADVGRENVKGRKDTTGIQKQVVSKKNKE